MTRKCVCGHVYRSISIYINLHNLFLLSFSYFLHVIKLLLRHRDVPLRFSIKFPSFHPPCPLAWEIIVLVLREYHTVKDKTTNTLHHRFLYIRSRQVSDRSRRQSLYAPHDYRRTINFHLSTFKTFLELFIWYQ